MKLFVGILLSVLLLIQILGGVNGLVKNKEEFQDYIRQQLKPDPETSSAAYVTIKQGTMKGFTARAMNNNTIYSYMRIPFGKPPVDELRFKAPQPADGWGDEILDATQLTPACPQVLTAVVPAQEDCLFLNVYSSRTGNETDREPAPVLVWMFGGGFGVGESSYYTGHRLLSQDLVLVVPNYRVNLFGFLATGDAASPGNYGLKDQNLALRWVQENIGAFGGDPNRVTIIGESAGSASVMLHLLSPLSHGLFHGVIAQSASMIEPWAIDENPLRYAHKIATRLNCPIDTTVALVDCMRTLPWVNISTTFVTTLIDDGFHLDVQVLGVAPVVEPDLPGAFLTEDPIKIMTEGYMPDVPVLTGCNSEEGSLFIGALHFLNFVQLENTIDNPAWQRETLLNSVLAPYGVPQGFGIPVEEVFGLAFMPKSNRLHLNEISDELVDLMSVVGLKGAVLKAADILSRRLSSVYFYSFEYVGDKDNSLWYYVFDLLIPIIGGEVPPYAHGVTHADDLIYEFNFPFILNDTDLEFASMYAELWSNFAHFGNPTPEASDKYPVWPKYTWRDPNYFILTNTPSVAKDYTKQWTQ